MKKYGVVILFSLVAAVFVMAVWTMLNRCVPEGSPVYKQYRREQVGVFVYVPARYVDIYKGRRAITGESCLCD